MFFVSIAFSFFLQLQENYDTHNRAYSVSKPLILVFFCFLLSNIDIVLLLLQGI